MTLQVVEPTGTGKSQIAIMLSMLRLADKEGEVSIDALIEEYRRFYIDRLDRGLPVDRRGCAYDREFLDDPVKVKRSILANPFEKFERKRFVYYSKDLNILSFHPALWEQMSSEVKERIGEKERGFLERYYERLGGV